MEPTDRPLADPTRSAPILVEEQDGVVTITLADPARRNVLSRAMIDALTAAFAEVAASPATGVILAAEGPAFSAGHDIAELEAGSLAQIEELFAACSRMMLSIRAMPQVVVARVHGLATAAGCQLVASCDLVVAARSAAFALPGGRGGLFCHTPLVAVARSIGAKRAAQLAFTGDPISAERAERWGLVNVVVDDPELNAATAELLRAATRGSAASKARGKAGFYEQIELPEAAAYTAMSARMAADSQSPAAREGFAAFLGKRKAVFPE